MPRDNPRDMLLPSVLDRLFDDNPDISTEPGWHRAQSVRDLMDDVKRDLEALLNTRQTRSDLPPEFEFASQSVLTYGLPDFMSAGAGSEDERAVLRLAVEQAIARFEPRLLQVHVSLVAPESSHDRSLHLLIEGHLQCNPNPIPITFDTVVQPSTGQCVVQAK